jgi:hypothetical protein
MPVALSISDVDAEVTADSDFAGGVSERRIG